MKEVVAFQLYNEPRVLPVFEYARNDGEKHAMSAVRCGDDIGRPVRRVVSAHFSGELNFGCTDIRPRRPEIGGFGEANARTMNPGNPGKTGSLGPATRKKHPPFLFLCSPPPPH